MILFIPHFGKDKAHKNENRLLVVRGLGLDGEKGEGTARGIVKVIILFCILTVSMPRL